MYCHGLSSPSVSGRQQSRLCTTMAYHHPQSQADSSPDCLLPWPIITLSLRHTAVQTVYCHGLSSPSVSGRQQSRLCTTMAYHHPQSQAYSSPDCVLPWPIITLSLRQTAVQTVYYHGLSSPSVSGIQQSRLSTAMAYHHPQSQADSSPDCVLPWPNITLSLRQTAVQTVYCHGLTSPSVSGRQQSRLSTAMAYHHPQSQADSSPDCVLPWPNITLSLRQTAVQTVYYHGLTSPSVSGRQQSRLSTALA